MDNLGPSGSWRRSAPSPARSSAPTSPVLSHNWRATSPSSPSSSSSSSTSPSCPSPTILANTGKWRLNTPPSTFCRAPPRDALQAGVLLYLGCVPQDSLLRRSPGFNEGMQQHPVAVLNYNTESDKVEFRVVSSRKNAGGLATLPDRLCKKYLPLEHARSDEREDWAPAVRAGKHRGVPRLEYEGARLDRPSAVILDKDSFWVERVHLEHWRGGAIRLTAQSLDMMATYHARLYAPSGMARVNPGRPITTGRLHTEVVVLACG